MISMVLKDPEDGLINMRMNLANTIMAEGLKVCRQILLLDRVQNVIILGNHLSILFNYTTNIQES